MKDTLQHIRGMCDCTCGKAEFLMRVFEGYRDRLRHHANPEECPYKPTSHLSAEQNLESAWGHGLLLCDADVSGGIEPQYIGEWHDTPKPYHRPSYLRSPDDERLIDELKENVRSLGIRYRASGAEREVLEKRLAAFAVENSRIRELVDDDAMTKMREDRDQLIAKVQVLEPEVEKLRAILGQLAMKHPREVADLLEKES